MHPNLSLRITGCFSSDKFSKLPDNCFAAINTERAGLFGEHWILLVSKKQVVSIYDSFSRPVLLRFPEIYNRVKRQNKTANQILTPFVQSHKSFLFAFYCF